MFYYAKTTAIIRPRLTWFEFAGCAADIRGLLASRVSGPDEPDEPDEPDKDDEDDEDDEAVDPADE